MSVYEEEKPNRYATILQERRQRKFARQERKRHIPHLNKHMRETAKARWEMCEKPTENFYQPG
jgi:hypothetical protein